MAFSGTTATTGRACGASGASGATGGAVGLSLRRKKLLRPGLASSGASVNTTRDEYQTNRRQTLPSGPARNFTTNNAKYRPRHQKTGMNKVPGGIWHERMRSCSMNGVTVGQNTRIPSLPTQSALGGKRRSRQAKMGY